MGSLHVYSRLEAEPADLSLLDEEQVLCAHFAKVAHTPFTEDGCLSPAAPPPHAHHSMFSKLFFAIGKTFCIFAEAQSSKDVFF